MKLRHDHPSSSGDGSASVEGWSIVQPPRGGTRGAAAPPAGSSIDRFFGRAPGPDGYLVVCLRHPVSRAFLDGARAFIRPDGQLIPVPNQRTDADELAAELLETCRELTPEERAGIPWPDGTTLEWSRDHLARWHGWDAAQTEMWFCGELDEVGHHLDGHENDHGREKWEDVERPGNIPIPHIHYDGAAWAIAHDRELDENVRRSLVQLVSHVGDS